MKRVRQFAWLVGLFLFTGCGPLSQEQIQQEVSLLTARVDKLGREEGPFLPTQEERATAPRLLDAPNLPASPVVQTVAFNQDVKLPPAFTPPKKLIVPPELPGANEESFRLPENKEKRQEYIRGLFPPLPPLPAVRPPAPGPEGRPLTLPDLQRLALTFNPAVKNARAAVSAAEGAVQQADAYPNPTLNIQQDTVGTGPAGYQGLGVSQLIKTWGKLKLQRAAALMDLLNARVALRRAETDAIYQLRGYYFAVLVALESNRINEAMYRFADSIYRYQVEILEKSGFSTVYQPMQLRPLATQARLNVIQARNQYLASWRQLAAALGLPDMPPSELASRIDQPLPNFDFDKVREYMLENHTDVVTAINSIQKAHYVLELAKVVPVPDVTVTGLVQKDYTTTPEGQIVYSAQFSVPIPIWDQNRGNIKQAEGQLRQAAAQLPQSRNALLTTLADAFNRFETNRESVAITLDQVKDQVRVYRGLRARYESDPNNVSFGGDLVTAQQTLATYINAYAAALGLQWQAAVDVANLLQNDDLYQAGQPLQMTPVPELELPPTPRIVPPQQLPEAAAPAPKSHGLPPIKINPAFVEARPSGTP